MVETISFELLLNVYRIYSISSSGKLKEKDDPIFLKVSKKLKVKKEILYALLQKHWNQILLWQPVLELVDCCRPNNVSNEEIIYSNGEIKAFNCDSELKVYCILF